MIESNNTSSRGLQMTSSEQGKIIKKWILAYLGAITYIVVPLYMKRGYYSLIRAKAMAYLYCAIPALIAVLVVEAAELSSSGELKIKENTGQNRGRTLQRPRTSLILLTVIGGWALCSSFLSQNFKLSLMGTAGWSVGSLMTAVLVLTTVYVSRQYYCNFHMVLAVMAVNTVINLFAVIQSAGIDLFGLLKDIEQKQHYTYLSTIGQKNSYSGYLCLLLPLFWGAFIKCREQKKTILFGMFAALGFMGIIMAESDSTYAGVGICLLFMLPFVFGAELYIKRSSLMLMMYSVCLLLTRKLPVFAGKIARFKGISKAMIQRPIAEIIFLCAIVLYFFGWKILGGKIGKYILIVVELAAIGLICAYAVKTARNFHDKWGTNRGMTWRISWEQFQQFPLRNKLVGVGPEMLVTVYAKMRAATGRNVTSAHCEPLQVLLTQGIVGLCIYFSFWGYLLKLFFSKGVWKSEKAIYFFPLAAYWGQSIFCSVYPVTAVLFAFAAGMYLKVAEEC